MLAGARAVLFDAGFTLLEPRRAVVEVYHDEAAALGVSLERERFAAHMTATWRHAVTDYRSAAPEFETSDELERQAWHRFTLEVARPFPELVLVHATWLDRLFAHFDAPAAWCPVAGAADLLSVLRGRGVVVGVVSNWHSVLHRILEGVGLRRHLDFVLTSAEVGRKKPHASIFARALQTAGVHAHEAWHVGDSWRDDVEGALAAGIRPILIAAESPESVDARVTVVRSLANILA